MSVGSTAGISYNIPNEPEIQAADDPSSYIHGVFEVGYAPVPQLEGGINSATQQGPNIAILNDSTDAERLAAWLLIKHLTNEENTIAWSMETGYLPVRISAIESDEYQEFLTNPDIDYVNESNGINAALSQTEYFQYDPAFALRTSSASARNQAELALVAIYLETKSIDDAIQNMLDQLLW
jgi:multiple sugar transport system substrate-binding protein